MKTPVIGGEVDGAASYQPGIADRRLEKRLVSWIFAKSIGLQLIVVSDCRLPQVFQLIVLEILFFYIGPLFEHDNCESGFGQFLRHDSAGSPRTDDREVDLGAGCKELTLGWHVSLNVLAWNRDHTSQKGAQH